MQLPITILPGDRRMDFAADYLAKKGGTFCSSWSQIPESGYIVGGIPFTRDGRTVNTSIPEPLAIQSLLGMLTPNHILVGGNLPESVTTACTHHGIKYYDVMTSGDFVQKNARLTAEGLLIPLIFFAFLSANSMSATSAALRGKLRKPAISMLSRETNYRTENTEYIRSTR